jgi:hypothetical protein
VAWGPVGAATVLRPWAERLVDALRPRPGECILDASADGGLLHRRLARAVGPGGTVIPHRPRSRRLVPGPPPDAAASLLSLQLAADPAAHLAELVEAVELRHGRVAVLVQVAEGSPHEAAAVEALGDTSGRPAVLDALQLDALLAATPLRAERLRDVVRFDGLGQLWTALVTERGIRVDLDAGRRGALEASLGRWIAADGTLRIAAEAVCLRHRG